jgi:hypothetical protein
MEDFFIHLMKELEKYIESYLIAARTSFGAIDVLQDKF